MVSSAAANETGAIGIDTVLAAAGIALLSGAMVSPAEIGALSAAHIPTLTQIIDQRSFAVLPNVPSPLEVDGNALFFPPGLDDEALKAKPFHIYDSEFLDIIGPNPTLTLLATGEDDPFHEAPIWIRETDEMFFAQNSGSKAAGTGVEKSAMIQKISLPEVAALSAFRDATGLVTVMATGSNATILNPNGGTNYKGQLLFVGDGQADHGAPAVYVMNPHPPYNVTTILNNYFGRQFNSIDDVSIHPGNKDIYFTDPTYGYVQDFRPPPGLQKQVWRFNDRTGAVTVVADGLNMPNGIAFSPEGSYAYITDTGVAQAFFGSNFTFPATIYRYDVKPDGTFENRKVFAFVSPGVPDGIHTDTKGNVYTACGDGVHVFNPSGTLLGKIYVGRASANFQFAGKGRMVILAETELYYATIAAEGSYVDEYL